MYRSYNRWNNCFIRNVRRYKHSEPNALIGFAGPRVVKDTTGQDLPDGFQKSEFLLEKGFLDFISHRKDLKKRINLYIDLIQNLPLAIMNKYLIISI